MRITIAGIALISLFLITIQLMEPTIGRTAIAKIQSQLKVHSSIKDYRLSIFKEFPRLSLILDNVSLEGANNTDFLKSKEVSLKMNIWNLLRGEYVFESISLKDTKIDILIDKDGQGNWDIFESSGDTSAINMIWQSVNFKNTTINYNDIKRDVITSFDIVSGSLKGVLSHSQLRISPKLNLEFKDVAADKIYYIQNLEASIKSGEILIDTKTSFYKFENLQIYTAKSDVSCKGTIHNTDEGIFFDLNLETDNGNISAIKAVLPRFLTESLDDYKITGNSTILCTYSGLLTDRYSPDFSIDFNASNTGIKHPNMPHPLKISETEGSMRINKYGKGSFNIKSLKGSYQGKDIIAGFSLEDFDNPTINGELSGPLPLQLFQPYFTTFDVKAGTVGVSDFAIKDLAFKKNSIDYSLLKGAINASGLEFEYKGQKILVPVLEGELHQSDVLIVDSSTIIYADSDIHINGSVKNFLGRMFYPSRNELAFDVNLYSDNLNLLKLEGLYHNIATTEAVVESDNDGDNSLFAEAIGRFRAKINHLTYDKVVASNFSGDLFLYPDAYKLKGSTNTCDGQITLDGNIARKEQMNFKGTLDFNGINVKTLFKQWDNFQQDIIHSEHLEGKLSGKSLIDLHWDINGDFLYDKMGFISTMNIDDGYLKDFTMLESFSSFVNVKDLRNIRFNKLQNVMIIREGNVYLPAMFIQSNALNLKVNGIHTLDNRVDYNVKVNGGQVLIKRFRNSSSEIIPAKQDGWFNLYYTITGTLPDNFNYKHDKRKVLSSFTQSLVMRNDYEKILKQTFPDLESITEPESWQSAIFDESDFSSFETIEGF